MVSSDKFNRQGVTWLKLIKYVKSLNKMGYKTVHLNNYLEDERYNNT